MVTQNPPVGAVAAGSAASTPVTAEETAVVGAEKYPQIPLPICAGCIDRPSHKSKKPNKNIKKQLTNQGVITMSLFRWPFFGKKEDPKKKEVPPQARPEARPVAGGASTTSSSNKDDGIMGNLLHPLNPLSPFSVWQSAAADDRRATPAASVETPAATTYTPSAPAAAPSGDSDRTSYSSGGGGGSSDSSSYDSGSSSSSTEISADIGADMRRHRGYALAL